MLLSDLKASKYIPNDLYAIIADFPKKCKRLVDRNPGLLQNLRHILLRADSHNMYAVTETLILNLGNHLEETSMELLEMLEGAIPSDLGQFVDIRA